MTTAFGTIPASFVTAEATMIWEGCQAVTLEGVLSLRGNEPLLIVGLETEMGENCALVGPLEKTLSLLAGQGNVSVEVKGYLVDGHTIKVISYGTRR